MPDLNRAQRLGPYAATAVFGAGVLSAIAAFVLGSEPYAAAAIGVAVTAAGYAGQLHQRLRRVREKLMASERERGRRAAQERLLQRMLDTVGASAAAERVARTLLRSVCEEVGAPEGTLILCEEQPRAHVLEHVGPARRKPLPPINDIFCRLTRQLDELRSVSSVSSSPLFEEEERDRLRQAGMQSLILMPLDLGRAGRGLACWFWPEEQEDLLDAETYGLLSMLRTPASTALQHGLRDEQHRYMFEESQAVKLVIDPDEGQIVDANPAAARFYGYSAEELRKKRISEINTLAPEQVREKMRSVLEGREAAMRFRHRLASGAMRDVEVLSSVVRVRGRFLLYSIIHDVTDRVNSERQLRASEERYRSLVENASEGIFRSRVDGELVEANRAFAQMVGYDRPEELIGVDVGEELYADESEREEIVARALEGGALAPYETRLIKKNGEEAIVRIHARHLRDEEGDLIGFEGIATDITEQREVERALRESEARYRTLVERFPEAIVVHDGRRILYANPASATFVNASCAEELVGRQIHEYVHPDYREVVSQRIRKVVQNRGAVDPLEERIIRSDGEMLDVEVTASHVIFEGRPASQIILRDVSERRRVRQRLERLASFPRQNPNPVVEVDVQGRVTYENPAAERAFPKLKEQGAAHPLLDELSTLASVVEERGHITVEREWNGSVYELQLSYVPHYELLRIYIAEVTQRYRHEQRITELKAFYEHTLNKLPIEVAVFDEGGHYLYVNPAHEPGQAERERMIGKTPQEVAAEAGRDLEAAHEQQRWLAEVAAAGSIASLERTVSRADGTIRHHRQVAAPVTNSEGEVVQLVSYRIDLTARKQYEEQLLEAKEQAEEMSRLKSAFLANMSHEVRTPLTGILGFASILQEELGDEYQELASLIHESGSRLLGTLNSILDLAKLEANALSLDIRPVDVCDVVRDTAGLFESLARKASLKLSVDLAEERVLALADYSGLHRVLNNLLSNAVKFTEEGGVRVRVVEGEQVEIRVEDTGPGIDPVFLPDLFVEFKQQSSGLDRSHQGSGLGLAITKRLIDEMDGSIDVETEPGCGTAFVVHLPRAVSSEPDPEISNTTLST